MNEQNENTVEDCGKVSSPSTEDRQQSSSIARSQIWLAAPAAVAIVAGVSMVCALLGNGSKMSNAQILQRGVESLATGNGASAAIDFRRLLQRDPMNEQIRRGLAAANASRTSPANQ